MPIFQQGMAQMTPAVLNTIRQGARMGSPTRRKASRKASSSSTSPTRKRKSGRKIKFGSPAWRKKYKLDKKK